METTDTACDDMKVFAEMDDSTKLKCGEVYYAWRNGFSFSCCICAAKCVQLDCYLAHLLQHDLEALQQDATGKPSTLQISSNDCQEQERSLTPLSVTYEIETLPAVIDITELDIEDTPDGSPNPPQEQSHDEQHSLTDNNNFDDENTNVACISPNAEQLEGENNHTSDDRSETTKQTITTSQAPMDTGTTSVRMFQSRYRDVKAPRPFACDLCDAKFMCKRVLKSHRFRHLGIKPHKCTLCEKRFTSSIELKTHKRTHTGERPFMCDDCGQSFTQSGILNTHKRRHRDERPYECPTCHKRFLTRGELRSHETMHNGLRPHVCDTCQATFSRKYSLKQHMKLHSEIKNTDFEYISLNAEQPEGENNHTSDDNSETTKQTTTSSQAQMDTGTTSVRMFQSRYRDLKALRPFACDLCDAKFSCKRVLKLHRFRHLGIKPHKCTLCEKRFTSNIELKTHKRTHTGERPFMCDECGKSFTQSGLLNTHKRRHRDERPYECPTCHKRFYSRSALRTHETMHNGLRPHVCDTCQATFSRRNSLKQHMKLHSEIKKHVCKVCGKSFAQLAGIYSHMKNYHNILKRSSLITN